MSEPILCRLCGRPQAPEALSLQLGDEWDGISPGEKHAWCWGEYFVVDGACSAYVVARICALQQELAAAEVRAIGHGTAIAEERISAALNGVRAVLGAPALTGSPDSESTVDAARRVVAEREALREALRETERDSEWLCATVRNGAAALESDDPEELAEVLAEVAEIETRNKAATAVLAAA